MQLATLKLEFEANQRIFWLYGNLRGDTWGTEELEFKGKVKVIAKGTGQKIRGLKYLQYRPDLVLCDDLENDDLVANADRRKKLKSWFLKNVIPGLARGGEIIVIGTILHFDSLLKNIIDRKDEFHGWNVVKYKAITEGKSIWPELWSVEDLNRMQHDPTFPYFIGSLVFAQEYLNEPMSGEDVIVKPEWIIEYNLAKKRQTFRSEENVDWIDTLDIYAGVDLAISKKETGHYFSITVIGIDEEGREWTLDYFRDRLTVDEQAEMIIKMHLTWKPKIIKLETVNYQEALRQVVISKARKRGINIPIRPFKPDKDKIRRMQFHSARIENGVVHWRSDHSLWPVIRDEMLQFPLGKFDDMIDSWMMADECAIKPRAKIRHKRPRAFSTETVKFGGGTVKF